MLRLCVLIFSLGFVLSGCAEPCETIDQEYLRIYEEQMHIVLTERHAAEDSVNRAKNEIQLDALFARNRAREQNEAKRPVGASIYMEVADGRSFTLGVVDDSLSFHGDIPVAMAATMLLFHMRLEAAR